MRPLAAWKVNPTSDPWGLLCVLGWPPWSSQVEGQGYGEDDPCQHQERQPSLQEGSAAGGRRESEETI